MGLLELSTHAQHIHKTRNSQSLRRPSKQREVTHQMTIECSDSSSEKTCAVRKIAATGELHTSEAEPASSLGVSLLTKHPSAGSSSTSKILTEIPVPTPLLR
ncbi:hypothetical protein PF008_g29460 [Phytophthora fragariae]|uniref:Uncharacterized protein n=1 Tax=Phytophthora fragariae TaxID=53985 RepID=A0A6G0Q8V4_9STRA|nr:hypothetical protein PF008_g29460 [Phytophthora fragariae]